MGRKHKAAGGGLGQALIKQRAQGARPTAGRYGGDRPLESITDVKDLDEVMEQAERAGRVFSALHPMPELLLEKEGDASNLTPREREEQRRAEEALHQASLTVPRRPAWEVGMTAEELDIQERQAFLTWRRGFVRLEENENLVITPFEKNIDIWRQLWRVIERSDLVVMVVDCRNPLFYRCPDLETYVQEVDPNKKTMLLLNKADLLPAAVRKQWAAYFVAKGISYLFWSAKNATAALEAKLEDLDLEDSVSDQDVAILSREELLSRLQTEAELIASTRREAVRAALAQHVGKEDGEVSQNGSSRVESSRVPSGQAGGDGAVRRVVVGFVGYPNVGKSSTINALVGGKKTGVTSTPGKTKHFQTLIINDKLMLCDCPGLVFPSFTSSRSEMVASGVLPIDRITDQRGPVDVVAQRVTRETLETVYGIKLPAPRPYEPQNRPPSASELLRAFAYSRGYVASSGLPDETRAARQILKDYSNGKLLHYLLPPDNEDDSARSLLHSRGHYQEEGASSASESLDSDEDGGYDSQDGGEDDQVRPDMLPGNEAGGAFDGDELDGEIVELQEASSSLQIEDQSPGAVNTSNQLLGLDPSTSGQGLADIFTDLDTVGNMGKRSPEKTRLKLKGGSSHKMHKKAPRKKDRSWRVQNDGSDGMPLVRGVLKPVSHGAEALRQVIV